MKNTYLFIKVSCMSQAACQRCNKVDDLQNRPACDLLRFDFVNHGKELGMLVPTERQVLGRTSLHGWHEDGLVNALLQAVHAACCAVAVIWRSNFINSFCVNNGQGKSGFHVQQLLIMLMLQAPFITSHLKYYWEPPAWAVFIKR